MRAHFLIFAACLLSAQSNVESDEIVRIGPGVTPPRLTRKIEPQYSTQARNDLIQGTVVLLITVTEKGRAADVVVISPLGFGLDEQAVRAVEQWEFKPGMKDGKPVKIMATVEVNFRFPEVWFDAKAERQRTSFNIALRTLNRPGARQSDIDEAVKTIMDLSRQKHAPSMFVAGSWMVEGKVLPKDEAAGAELIGKAAEKNFGPALYETAVRRIRGSGDLGRQKGMEDMRSAAQLGSAAAQEHLGLIYETGEGVAADLERSRRYYRLCATQGLGSCQFRLGRMLADAPGRPERDYLQAIALFQLAAAQGVSDAKKRADEEAAKLTPEQAHWVERLRAQIVRK